MAISKYGKNIQENINSVVTDGQFSNVVLKHLLDEKNKGVFKSPNPLTVTFKEAGKFDVQNPVVGNKASTLTDAQVKKIFSDGEDAKIRASLDALRNDNTGGNDDEDGPGGGGGNSNGGFTRPKCKKRWRQRGPISPLWPLPLPPIALAADLRPPILPPAPKLPKQNFFPPNEFPPPPLIETDETDFLPKTETIFQTDFSRPKTNLTDKKKNIVEVIPQLKKNLEDEEDLFKEKGLPVELSDALNKLFPDVKDQVTSEDIETAAPTVDFDELSEILTDTNKGRLPPQLDFFTGGHNEKFLSRAKNIGLSSNSSSFLNYLQSSI